MFKRYLLLFIIVFLVGCGYKPTKYYTKNEIKGDIYIESKIDINNIENSTLIKDLIVELLLKEFDVTVVSNKKSSDMVVGVSLVNVTHTPMKTSATDGYTSLYRTSVTVKFSYKNRTILVSDYYDYSVDDDSVVTDKKKLEAVEFAVSNALQNIFSKIAIESFRKSSDES